MMKRSPTSSVPRRRDWYSVPAGSLKVIGVLVLAAAAARARSSSSDP